MANGQADDALDPAIAYATFRSALWQMQVLVAQALPVADVSPMCYFDAWHTTLDATKLPSHTVTVHPNTPSLCTFSAFEVS